MPAQEKKIYDVIIVGGGPAGLSAALTLSRALKSVLLCTHGDARNAPSHEMHGYLTRDCTNPKEFLSIAYSQLAPYKVDIKQVYITKAERCADHFELCSENGETYFCKKLLLTTGLKDILPDIEGFETYYGTSIHHCPYCDGWEHRNQRLVVYAQGGGAVSLPYQLKGWSKQVTLCTDGAKKLLKPYDLDLLKCNEIPVYTKRIKKVEGTDKKLEKIVFEDGSELPCDAIFFSTGTEQRSALVTQLGCTISKKGNVKTDKFQQTNIGGLYVAGDAARDMNLVINAAAQGTKAAVAINMALQTEAMQLPEVGQALEEGL